MKRYLEGCLADAPVTVRAAPPARTEPLVHVPASGVSLGCPEHALIAFALQATRHNRTRTARFPGLTRSALLYRMRKHGLDDLAPAAPDAPAREIV